MAGNEDKDDTDDEWRAYNGRSHIWEHFLLKKDKKSVKCKVCQRSYVYNSQTSSHAHHLEKEHGIKRKDEQAEKSTDPQSSSTRQLSIFTSMAKAGRESLRKVLARMAAKDRIPFNTLATSLDIRYKY